MHIILLIFYLLKKYSFISLLFIQKLIFKKINDYPHSSVFLT